MDCNRLIKVFLAEQGSTRAELARRLGGSRAAVYDKLRRGDLRISQLERIAAAYGCRVRVVFEPDQEQRPEP